MAKRRSKGDGSIYQDDNGRWIGLVELPRQANGKRHRVKRRGRTRAEVVRKLREVRAHYEQAGEAPSTRLVSETIADYVTQVREAEKRSSSEVARDDLFARHLTEQLGRRRSTELTVQDCDLFLEAFASGRLTGSNRPLSRAYTNRIRSFLANALKNDLRQGYVVRNVAEVALVPNTSGRTKDKRALTVNEWRRLLDTATGPTKVGVDLGGRHGLRPQEARALLWSNVDLRTGTLSVVNQRDADDELADPKTEDSIRTIRLHAEATDLLTCHQANQQALSERYDWRWSNQTPVISTKFGTTIRQENYRRSLATACRQVGIAKVTPYELRHTAITHQIDAGRTASQVADWAGTSEPMIYAHYRHKLREVVEIAPLDY